MNKFKTCPRCNKKYPRTTEYFCRSKSRRDGFYVYCKKCNRELCRQYHEWGPKGPKTIEERFWEKVDKRGPDDCWEWTAGLFGRGYGGFSIDENNRPPAHRFAYELEHGPIPDGLYLLHNCDNRACVNPNHLSPGTHEENMEDMVQKGRQAKGEDNGQSKLTEADVREMRELYDHGRWTQAALAKRFGVARSLVSYVVRRIYWKHID